MLGGGGGDVGRPRNPITAMQMTGPGKSSIF